MPKVSDAKLRANLRDNYLSTLIDYFSNQRGEDPRRIKNNAIMLPVVDEMGNERYLTITSAVPTGCRDCLGYDGYEAAENYDLEAAEKAEKAAIRKQEAAAKAAERKARQEAALQKKMEEQAERIARGE